MKDVHIVMQGKGGVGKTLISSLLTQYFMSSEKKVLAFDADPINQSLLRFKGLPVTAINLMTNQEVDPRLFDPMIEKICSCDEEVIVIDSGASSFVPLGNYLIASSIIPFLLENDCNIYLHSVIVGGQGSDDTINGLDAILASFMAYELRPKFSVWLNPFFSPLEFHGSAFTETKFYDKYRDSISYLVELPDLDPRLFGADIGEMLKSGHTFAEVRSDPSLTIMIKHRLFVAQKKFFETIQRAGL